MGKTSTLIYLFSNFDNSELIVKELRDYQLTDFDYIFKFIEKNAKKVPNGIVKNIVDFAKNYS